METTVDDFWRMIVEQGCGVVVMLTNLEETGKVKCVKYWPEAGQPKTFGNVTIYLVKEKAYSGKSWLVERGPVYVTLLSFFTLPFFFPSSFSLFNVLVFPYVEDIDVCIT